MSPSMSSTAREAGNHPALEKGARLGYAANGVLHVLLAWIALQLAWSAYSGSADQAGALQTLAGAPLGSALLWVLVVGFVLLGLWQLAESFVRREPVDRLKTAAKSVVYLGLAWTTATVVQGSGSGGAGSGGASGGGGSSATAGLMAQPFGRVLVAVVGIAVVGVGGYHVIKGVRRKFLEDLRAHPGRWAERAGRVGYVAKGVALGVVGVLLAWAAATHDASRADGLDGALRTMLELPFGRVLLTLVALGFAAYGVYSFFRARYAKV
ncbi:DUF1206 domain-containing protein [Cellulomonas fimi]|uniref:DUF1206 domain-containing protein n=2 Tax=Cellulomonas fimi TaxID=1708 RepID=A0A7Y0QI26_CELFI|nr:DUF1206 domain-containing protein [Cellulomonas fimi]